MGLAPEAHRCRRHGARALPLAVAIALADRVGASAVMGVTALLSAWGRFLDDLAH